MGTYHNFLQRAVVGSTAMMCTLLYGAFDALICIIVHNDYLLLSLIFVVWHKMQKAYIFLIEIIDISRP